MYHLTFELYSIRSSLIKLGNCLQSFFFFVTCHEPQSSDQTRKSGELGGFFFFFRWFQWFQWCYYSGQVLAIRTGCGSLWLFGHFHTLVMRHRSPVLTQEKKSTDICHCDRDKTIYVCKLFRFKVIIDFIIKLSIFFLNFALCQLLHIFSYGVRSKGLRTGTDQWATLHTQLINCRFEYRLDWLNIKKYNTFLWQYHGMCELRTLWLIYSLYSIKVP